MKEALARPLNKQIRKLDFGYVEVVKYWAGWFWVYGTSAR
jgi:hypothetical protein